VWWGRDAADTPCEQVRNSRKSCEESEGGKWRMLVQESFRYIIF